MILFRYPNFNFPMESFLCLVQFLSELFLIELLSRGAFVADKCLLRIRQSFMIDQVLEAVRKPQNL
jgi:hypothetical protein